MSPLRVRRGLRVAIVLIGAVAWTCPALARAKEKKAVFEVVPADLLDPADRPARTPSPPPKRRARIPEAAALYEIVDEFGGFGGNSHDGEATSQTAVYPEFIAAMLPALGTGASAGMAEITWDFVPVMNEDIDTINRARSRAVDGLRAVNHEPPDEPVPAPNEALTATATLASDAASSGTDSTLSSALPAEPIETQ